MVLSGTVGRNKALLAAIVCAFLVTGCANMSDTGKRAGGGMVAGAAGGAAIGAMAGNPALGAGIGAAAGLAGGFLYDQHKKSEERAYQRGQADAQR